MRTLQGGLAIVILAACAAACGSSRPLQITAIQLGRSLNADHSVSEFTTVFAPRDTIHLSVLTSGGGTGTIGVRWTYRGTLVGESEQRVARQDFAATNFPMRSAAGFPPGDYNVEIFLDGKPAGTREFKVQ
jgi:hypothetical protein